MAKNQHQADSYTAVLVNNEEVGSTTIWTPAKLGVDDEAFQLMASRLDDLETRGVVRVLEKHREAGSGNRHFDLLRFKRLK